MFSLRSNYCSHFYQIFVWGEMDCVAIHVVCVIIKYKQLYKLSLLSDRIYRLGVFYILNTYVDINFGKTRCFYSID